uniref:CUE domain-containing protein n=1 Tax=Odontella aurita TaxID=265563 RepID=A0A7S4N9B0_9STRA|mmetsp:Transcript_52922/g.158424  ORF Transcript_52922/g.158424 Transcript_52922/m.158424 type:complete len:319 (+) Transcript_52922:263-1219(+)|eukprot:CAMPEP_0113525674 /NCGR_PEP_ID=MMETSP0015_2-20120614/301_1 /TAXON_ID=2838 /ORGANISM="Odontella" /LENGTH=318 /DNA_ID=CAMNT_0000423883 /DNA_START=226 /DNA_END=1182 /DNA_ORIENTATION=- /assembly_acc=CAM_ASM_000160
MSITYEEALSTLTSMFGSPWTKETLDTVLRHHEGHMENTVETVLSYGDGDPADLVERLKNPGSASEHVDADEELARQLAAESGRQNAAAGRTTQRAAGNAPATGPNGRKLRGTPTQLPPDFLRVPGGSTDIDGDEQLARMLQDELFTRELANNPEFAHLAGRGGGRGSSAGSGRGSTGASGLGRGAGGGGWFSGAGRSGAAGSGVGGFPGFGRGAAGRGAGGQHEGPNVIDNLKGMGDVARKRLTLFAQQFNERMNTPHGSATAAGVSGGSTGGMGGSSGVHERRGLLDGDGNDEEVAFLGANELDMEENPPGGKKND